MNVHVGKIPRQTYGTSLKIHERESDVRVEAERLTLAVEHGNSTYAEPRLYSHRRRGVTGISCPQRAAVL